METLRTWGFHQKVMRLFGPLQLTFRSSVGLFTLAMKSLLAAPWGPRSASAVLGSSQGMGSQFSTSLTLIPVFCPVPRLASQSLTQCHLVHLDNKPLVSIGWRNRTRAEQRTETGAPRWHGTGKEPNNPAAQVPDFNYSPIFSSMPDPGSLVCGVLGAEPLRGLQGETLTAHRKYSLQVSSSNLPMLCKISGHCSNRLHLNSPVCSYLVSME